MDHQNEGRGGGGKRQKKKKKKKMSAIQKVYEFCNQVFADSVPSSHNLQTLASLLDEMSGQDVGLHPNMPYFTHERAPIITYNHLHHSQKFSMGIFCLPPGTLIPLHNHPGMTVLTKLLFGTMHIKSFDWSNQHHLPSLSTNGLRLARLKVDSEFTAPCRTSIVYPSEGGNMHCLTARTACAFLDVMGPPYSEEEGRHCQYYQELPLSEFPDVKVDGEKEEYAWLKEREIPEEVRVVGEPYNGPKITLTYA